MTKVVSDINGVSDFISDGSHNIVTYYKSDKTFHELRESKPCRVTGKDITIEHFSTDTERVTRFKSLNLKIPEWAEVHLPERFRKNKN